MALAATTYNGTPCKRGHVLRHVNGGRCVECNRARSAAWDKANAERVKERSAARRLANPDRERARHAAQYAANPQRALARHAMWRKAHPDYNTAAMAAWRKKNPERARANGRAYYRANPEKFRIKRAKADKKKAVASSLAWQKRNRAAVNAGSARHNARKRNAPGSGVTAAQWREVLAESLGLCAYCGERKPLTMDHVEPIALGGAHDIDNIAAACGSCNSSKNDTPLVVWLALRALARRAA